MAYLFPMVLEAGNSWSKCQYDQVFSVGPLPDYILTWPFLSVHIQIGSKLSCVSSYKATNLLMNGLLSWTNSFLNVPSPKTITFGVRISIYELGSWHKHLVLSNYPQGTSLLMHSVMGYWHFGISERIRESEFLEWVKVVGRKVMQNKIQSRGQE
jgi:hypothetical protein